MSTPADAREDVARAASRSGVTVRELASLDDCRAAEAVCNAVFAPEAGSAAITVEWMRVLAKTGNYVGGAFAEDELIGMAVGLRSGPTGDALHSHVAAVLGEHAGQGVGFTLKLHQRAWAAAKGMPTISWTFDPLVRRNAHLNLVKLGAHPADYLPNFYGTLRDGRNGDDETDRLLVEWPLLDEHVSAVCRGERRTVAADAGGFEPLLEITDDAAPKLRSASSRLVGIAVPPDIEALRQSRPQLAREWRLAVRESLGAELEAGSRVVAFDSAGVYVLARGGVG